tara:strand:- start:38 stop:151 length:114 start_codon:yes stop_codon:yes gene_type:complete
MTGLFLARLKIYPLLIIDESLVREISENLFIPGIGKS